MKRVITFILVLALCFILVSCETGNNQVNNVEKYRIGSIIVTLPADMEVDASDNNGYVFTNGIELYCAESNVNTKARFDSTYEDLKAMVSCENVSKCELLNMPTISLFINEHPTFYIFDLEHSVVYYFYFEPYTIDNEIEYMNIMENLTLSTSKEE